MADVMVVISKVYDLISWVVPVTEKFPRALRFRIMDRISKTHGGRLKLSRADALEVLETVRELGPVIETNLLRL